MGRRRSNDALLDDAVLRLQEAGHKDLGDELLSTFATKRHIRRRKKEAARWPVWTDVVAAEMCGDVPRNEAFFEKVGRRHKVGGRTVAAEIFEETDKLPGAQEARARLKAFRK
jgi:hypothetical protein